MIIMKINPKSIAVIFIIGIIVLYALNMLEKETLFLNQQYCENDYDCACGINIETGECFYGNVKFVDMYGQCPDFCNGIDGKLTIKCVNNACRQM